MKILLTVHQFFPDYSAGTEVLTRSVARELLLQNHEVHVLTAFPEAQSKKNLEDSHRFDEYDIEGIHVYRFHHSYTPMGKQNSMLELSYNNHLAANFFRKILDSYKPDVVHFFHLNRLGTGLIEHAVEAGVAAYYTPTDFWSICPTGQLVLSDGTPCKGPDIYAGNCVKHFAQNTQKGSANHIVKWLPTSTFNYLTRLTRKNILPNYPYKIEVESISKRLFTNKNRLNLLHKIITPNSFMTKILINHGISEKIILQSGFGIDIINQNYEKRRDYSHTPLRVGFIGTLAPHKGCHILIDAFQALPKEKATLKIYGNLEDFTDYVKKLRANAEPNKNSNEIEFCGTFPNSNIGEILNDLDVLVIPSLWYENTPLVLHSAQAAGCPVIASNFPGISEIIEHNVNGLLFEPGNSVELKKQLLLLISERDLAKKISQGSKKPKSIKNYVNELLQIWSNKD